MGGCTACPGATISKLKKITLLGSTGSIGQSALDVIRRWPDRFRVYALVAGRNVELLARQISEFQPEFAAVESATDARKLAQLLPSECRTEISFGPQARIRAATAEPVDFVLSAIVGVAGLEATYRAVQVGKTIGLANKEVLVACGELVMKAAADSKAQLIPIDSEHNGLHQCLRAGRREEVVRVLLTASGGPFRETPLHLFPSIKPQQALQHPTWKMGQRITIDSATMMNKGFEVIEACWLFGLKPSQVEVVIHPQSTVHALVEFVDGSFMLQASTTDMRMPIQYALTYPERISAPVASLSWEKARTWEFYPPEEARFPLLKLAYEALRTGGSAGCVLNAADEVAVQAFLNHEISFPQIADVIRHTLDRVPHAQPASVEEVMDIDRQARALARQSIERASTVRV